MQLVLRYLHLVLYITASMEGLFYAVLGAFSLISLNPILIIFRLRLVRDGRGFLHHK